MMSKIFFLLLYGISIVTLPWWVVVLVALVLISHFEAYVFAVLGGVVMDVMYGAPIHALADFSYLYTTVFLTLSCTAYILRVRLLE